MKLNLFLYNLIWFLNINISVFTMVRLPAQQRVPQFASFAEGRFQNFAIPATHQKAMIPDQQLARVNPELFRNIQIGQPAQPIWNRKITRPAIYLTEPNYFHDRQDLVSSEEQKSSKNFWNLGQGSSFASVGIFTPTRSKLMSARLAENILGLSENASEKEIKAAYRKKAMQLHPDIDSSRSNVPMQELNAARDFLLATGKTGNRKEGAEGKSSKKGFSTKTKAAIGALGISPIGIEIKDIQDDLALTSKLTEQKKIEDLKPRNRPENMSDNELMNEKYNLGYSLKHYLLGYDRSYYTSAYTKSRLAEIDTELKKRRAANQEESAYEAKKLYQMHEQ